MKTTKTMKKALLASCFVFMHAFTCIEANGRSALEDRTLDVCTDASFSYEFPHGQPHVVKGCSPIGGIFEGMFTPEKKKINSALEEYKQKASKICGSHSYPQWRSVNLQMVAQLRLYRRNNLLLPLEAPYTGHKIQNTG